MLVPVLCLLFSTEHDVLIPAPHASAYNTVRGSAGG